MSKIKNKLNASDNLDKLAKTDINKLASDEISPIDASEATLSNISENEKDNILELVFANTNDGFIENLNILLANCKSCKEQLKKEFKTINLNLIKKWEYPVCTDDENWIYILLAGEKKYLFNYADLSVSNNINAEDKPYILTNIMWLLYSYLDVFTKENRLTSDRSLEDLDKNIDYQKEVEDIYDSILPDNKSSFLSGDLALDLNSKQRNPIYLWKALEYIFSKANEEWRDNKVDFKNRDETSVLFLIIEEIYLEYQNNSKINRTNSSTKLIKDIYEQCLFYQIVENKNDDWIPNVDEKFWYPGWYNDTLSQTLCFDNINTLVIKDEYLSKTNINNKNNNKKKIRYNYFSSLKIGKEIQSKTELYKEKLNNKESIQKNIKLIFDMNKKISISGSEVQSLYDSYIEKNKTYLNQTTNADKKAINSTLQNKQILINKKTEFKEKYQAHLENSTLLFVETILQLDLTAPSINYLPEYIIDYIHGVINKKEEKSQSQFSVFGEPTENIIIDWSKWQFWKGKWERVWSTSHEQDNIKTTPQYISNWIKFTKWKTAQEAKEIASNIVIDTNRESLMWGLDGVLDYYNENQGELVVDVSSILVSIRLSRFTFGGSALVWTASKLQKLWKLIKIAGSFTIYSNLTKWIGMWTLETMHGGKRINWAYKWLWIAELDKEWKIVYNEDWEVILKKATNILDDKLRELGSNLFVFGPLSKFGKMTNIQIAKFISKSTNKVITGLSMSTKNIIISSAWFTSEVLVFTGFGVWYWALHDSVTNNRLFFDSLSDQLSIENIWVQLIQNIYFLWALKLGNKIIDPIVKPFHTKIEYSKKEKNYQTKIKKYINISEKFGILKKNNNWELEITTIDITKLTKKQTTQLKKAELEVISARNEIIQWQIMINQFKESKNTKKFNEFCKENNLLSNFLPPEKILELNIKKTSWQEKLELEKKLKYLKKLIIKIYKDSENIIKQFDDSDVNSIVFATQEYSKYQQKWKLADYQWKWDIVYDILGIERWSNKEVAKKAYRTRQKENSSIRTNNVRENIIDAKQYEITKKQDARNRFNKNYGKKENVIEEKIKKYWQSDPKYLKAPIFTNIEKINEYWLSLGTTIDGKTWLIGNYNNWVESKVMLFESIWDFDKNGYAEVSIIRSMSWKNKKQKTVFLIDKVWNLLTYKDGYGEHLAVVREGNEDIIPSYVITQMWNIIIYWNQWSNWNILDKKTKEVLWFVDDSKSGFVVWHKFNSNTRSYESFLISPIWEFLINKSAWFEHIDIRENDNYQLVFDGKKKWKTYKNIYTNRTIIYKDWRVKALWNWFLDIWWKMKLEIRDDKPFSEKKYPKILARIHEDGSIRLYDENRTELTSADNSFKSIRDIVPKIIDGELVFYNRDGLLLVESALTKRKQKPGTDKLDKTPEPVIWEWKKEKQETKEREETKNRKEKRIRSEKNLEQIKKIISKDNNWNFLIQNKKLWIYRKYNSIVLRWNLLICLKKKNTGDIYELCDLNWVRIKHNDEVLEYSNVILENDLLICETTAAKWKTYKIVNAKTWERFIRHIYSKNQLEIINTFNEVKREWDLLICRQNDSYHIMSLDGRFISFFGNASILKKITYVPSSELFICAETGQVEDLDFIIDKKWEIVVWAIYKTITKINDYWLFLWTYSSAMSETEKDSCFIRIDTKSKNPRSEYFQNDGMVRSIATDDGLVLSNRSVDKSSIQQKFEAFNTKTGKIENMVKLDINLGYLISEWNEVGDPHDFYYIDWTTWIKWVLEYKTSELSDYLIDIIYKDGSEIKNKTIFNNEYITKQPDWSFHIDIMIEELLDIYYADKEVLDGKKWSELVSYYNIKIKVDKESGDIEYIDNDGKKRIFFEQILFINWIMQWDNILNFINKEATFDTNIKPIMWRGDLHDKFSPTPWNPNIVLWYQKVKNSALYTTNKKARKKLIQDKCPDTEINRSKAEAAHNVGLHKNVTIKDNKFTIDDKEYTVIKIESLPLPSDTRFYDKYVIEVEPWIYRELWNDGKIAGISQDWTSNRTFWQRRRKIKYGQQAGLKSSVINQCLNEGLFWLFEVNWNTIKLSDTHGKICMVTKTVHTILDNKNINNIKILLIWSDLFEIPGRSKEGKNSSENLSNSTIIEYKKDGKVWFIYIYKKYWEIREKIVSAEYKKITEIRGKYIYIIWVENTRLRIDLEALPENKNRLDNYSEFESGVKLVDEFDEAYIEQGENYLYNNITNTYILRKNWKYQVYSSDGRILSTAYDSVIRVLSEWAILFHNNIDGSHLVNMKTWKRIIFKNPGFKDIELADWWYRTYGKNDSVWFADFSGKEIIAPDPKYRDFEYMGSSFIRTIWINNDLWLYYYNGSVWIELIELGKYRDMDLSISSDGKYLELQIFDTDGFNTGLKKIAISTFSPQKFKEVLEEAPTQSIIWKDYIQDGEKIIEDYYSPPSCKIIKKWDKFWLINKAWVKIIEPIYDDISKHSTYWNKSILLLTIWNKTQLKLVIDWKIVTKIYWKDSVIDISLFDILPVYNKINISDDMWKIKSDGKYYIVNSKLDVIAESTKDIKINNLWNGLSKITYFDWKHNSIKCVNSSWIILLETKSKILEDNSISNISILKYNYPHQTVLSYMKSWKLWIISVYTQHWKQKEQIISPILLEITEVLDGVVKAIDASWTPIELILEK